MANRVYTFCYTNGNANKVSLKQKGISKAYKTPGGITHTYRSLSKVRFLLPTFFFSLFSFSFLLLFTPTQFVLGEQSSSVNTENLAAANTGDFSVAGDTSGVSFANNVLTINGGSPTISMATEGASTTQRIEVTDESSITLAGVNINTSHGAALKIEDNAAFNVNITLADGSENTLTATVSNYAGLQKNGDSGVDMLTITGSTGENAGKLTATGGYNAAGIGGGYRGSGTAITISGGVVTATGGFYGAGIGGGWRGNGSNIEITGGIVTATGGYGGAGIGNGGTAGIGSQITISGGTVTATGGFYGAGIGGGNNGSGSDNSLNGDAVVMATSGDAIKPALEGFVDAQQESLLTQGIAFTRQTTSGTWSGTMYSNAVMVTASVKFPADLEVGVDKVLTVGSKVTLTIAEGTELTNNGTLVNEGTITDNGTLACNGTITTRTHFYLADGTVYGTDNYYQTYQTSAGVQKYKDLPNPDDPTLLENSLNSDKFEYWYYLNTSGAKVPISDTTDVLLNQHTFYEETTPEPTPPDPEPTPADDGWKESEGGWQYFVDGMPAQNLWVWIDDVYGAHWYFFGEDTYMKANQWLWDENYGAWYFCSAEGGMVSNEWLWDDVCSAWYYCNANGGMDKGCWQWIGDEWYGFDWNGKMCIGWTWDADLEAWYFCANNGVMARSTFIDGYWVDQSGMWLA